MRGGAPLTLAGCGVRRPWWGEAVDLAVKVRYPGHVELDGGQIRSPAVEQLDDVIDNMAYGGWRLGFGRFRKAPTHPGARLVVAAFGQLGADDSVCAPGEATVADPGGEDREALCRHEGSAYPLADLRATVSANGQPRVEGGSRARSATASVS